MVRGEIYLMSVEQGYQKSEVIKAGPCILHRHYCGFCFITGEPNANALDDIYMKAQDLDRAVLFTNDDTVIDYCKRKNIKTGTRYFFEYKRKEVQVPDIPEGFRLQPVNKDNIYKLEGRIKPDFSWDNNEDFLSKGIGLLLTKDDEPAAWAFSAAVSDTEIDIGVETNEKYRGKGLSTIVASSMADVVLKQGKTPVWACDSNNIASQKVALKAGFEKIGECTTVVLKG